MHALAIKAITLWDVITGPPTFVMHRENAVFKVKTKAGYAALRIHRPGYHSSIEIESELMWMAHLVQTGVDVPTPFRSSSGQFIAEVHDDQNQPYSVDLLSWLDGEPLGRSSVPLAFSKAELSDIFFNVGCTLAHLHNASDAWALPKGFVRHALDKEGLIGETAAWGKFWEASCLTAREQAMMRDACKRAEAKLDVLSASGADYGLIHADLVRENILIANGQTKFIDFDDAGFGFRMFDLAIALTKNRNEPHYETIKAQLFAGYKANRKLSPSDESSLNLFLALRDFAYLGWADARRNEPDIGSRLASIKTETLAAAASFLSKSVICS